MRIERVLGRIYIEGRLDEKGRGAAGEMMGKRRVC